MGREIRMVPPNWEHPQRDPEYDRNRHGGYQPMYDQTYEDACQEWLADFDRIRAGDLKEYEKNLYPYGVVEWATDNILSEPCYYRPWKNEEATWFQVWETVSEGTPVSPPFATREELIEYLAMYGDYWDQSRNDGPWTRENAAAFVGSGWAPSLVITPISGEPVSPRDFLAMGL